MGLDIRTPLGLLFSIIGGMLTFFGLSTRHSTIYASSLGVDVNLIWGVLMLCFGLGMLLLSWRGRRQSSR